MFIKKRRGQGLHTNCIGIKDTYNYYKDNYQSDIDYDTFSKIIKLCNREILNTIVLEGDVFVLPYRLGDLQISKFERGFNKPKNKWAIDYKKSRELGFIVYHDSKFIYKWRWNKIKSIVINKTKYKFEASRQAKRLVPKALETKQIDYFK